MFLAADGQDGSGLQPEKVGPTFSSHLCTVVSQKNQKSLGIPPRREFPLYIPSGLIGAGICA